MHMPYLHSFIKQPLKLTTPLLKKSFFFLTIHIWQIIIKNPDIYCGHNFILINSNNNNNILLLLTKFENFYYYNDNNIGGSGEGGPVRGTLSSTAKRKDDPWEEGVVALALLQVVIRFTWNYGIAGGFSVGIRGARGNLGIFISYLWTIHSQTLELRYCKIRFIESM